MQVDEKHEPTPEILLHVDQVAGIIGVPVELWEGQCYGIALALVEHGLIEGKPRYGHWLGAVAPGTLFHGKPLVPHGWVELDRGRIADPTRWVFEGTEPYIYIGENDYYDMGGNVYRSMNLKPPPQWEKTEKQKVYDELPPEAAAHIAALLGYTGRSLSLGQRFWLLNLPLHLLEPHTRAIYRCAVENGDSAIIPIDNRWYVLGD
jgi:hypothetical protein